jgi:hypothetical protein
LKKLYTSNTLDHVKSIYSYIHNAYIPLQFPTATSYYFIMFSRVMFSHHD